MGTRGDTGQCRAKGDMGQYGEGGRGDSEKWGNGSENLGHVGREGGRGEIAHRGDTRQGRWSRGGREQLGKGDKR